jgi:hypothetical protein
MSAARIAASFRVSKHEAFAPRPLQVDLVGRHPSRNVRFVRILALPEPTKEVDQPGLQPRRRMTGILHEAAGWCRPKRPSLVARVDVASGGVLPFPSGTSRPGVPPERNLEVRKARPCSSEIVGRSSEPGAERRFTP